MSTIFTCEQQSDVFVDALACDSNLNLIFLSLYGRDGSIQQFMSRIHLGTRDDGISKIVVKNPDTSKRYQSMIGDPRRLEKLTGQLPKGGLFGKLAHVWIFDPAITKPDKANKRGWLLFDEHHDELAKKSQIWSLIQMLSPVPLLPHWQSRVEALINGDGTGSSGIKKANALGPISPVEIVLPEDFEQLISSDIRAHRLTLESSHEVTHSRAAA